jgi:tetratricopeptide (TPR) repeat protein
VFDEIIDASERQDFPDVKWRALHERAAVAGMGGEYARSIQFAYAALQLAPSERDRDRILGDIATAFSELGLIDIARDAYLVLLATAQDQYVRWVAAMNMMEIAGRQRSEPVFDRYRRELASVRFPPYLHAKFLLTLGNGYRQLGKPDLAITYLEQAVEYSRENGLNHVLFEAEDGLAAAQHDSQIQSPEVAELIPTDIVMVADAIRAMRQTVDAGA